MDYYDHLKNYNKKYQTDADFKQRVDAVDTEALKRDWLLWYPTPPITVEQVEAFIEDHLQYDVDTYEYLLFRWIEATQRS